jgi:phage repressor protein C with HTH and peptisase S24 domain
MSTLGERIVQARKDVGLTQRQVGDHFGVTANAISLWEKDETAPSAARIEELAKLLNVTFTWLATGEGDMRLILHGDPNQPAPRLHRARDVQTTPLPSRNTMPQNLPVLGVTAGGDGGDFDLNGETIDYLLRPPGLAGVRDAFALFVISDSMYPRFAQGETVFVHPHRPVRPGDDVVVELKAPEGQALHCYLKRLVKRTASELVLEQFNPPRRDIRIPVAKVRNVYRILTPNELLGV